ncbi:methyl-accepting chemotaxis protein [Chitinasiproducens palmae]|uniref:Methyl-accepting chemotaxis protein n=1 Tax=Chitinasiproducens palmae TaxID=1770053 RepID=A0A1H2PP69_9BURK|nr:methyl-accepting chemotaxis protein [Chitinasiproducens palmae]SDV48434.1 methyl-accepting chemotaxis protein [Chitinasiproducens palmae]
MNLTNRLMTALLGSAVALLFVGGLGLYQLQRSQDRFESVQENIMPSIVELNRARTALTTGNVAVYKHMLASDAAGKSAMEKLIAESDADFDRSLNHYRQQLVADDQDRQLVEAEQAAMEAYRRSRTQVLALSTANDTAGMNEMIARGDGTKAARAVNAALDEQYAYNKTLGDRLRAENRASYHFAVAALAIVIGLTLLVSGVLGGRLYRDIRQGLHGMRDLMQSLAQTLDLRRRAPADKNDELGQTAVAFNGLLGKLEEVVASVRHTVGSVQVAAREIAAGNQDLSSRTEEQAASLEETASSIDEFSATVRHNADNARQAAGLASNATDVAVRGSSVVDSMVGTMSEIRSHSARIADITTLIDGIAFQTNILALNAAVEAARAGDSGRGFSVVAGEVRSLAQRSASAAKEIKALVETSVQAVETGAAHANDTGQAMAELKQAVARVTDVIGEIAAASEEQSRGIEQVNLAIGQIDQVTQQNAALVEQSAAAAHSLDEQARSLRDAVEVFKVGETTRAVGAATAVASTRSVAAAPVTQRPERKPAAPAPKRVAQPALAAAGDWESF